MPARDLDLIRRAALHAGEIALHHFGRPLHPREKPGGQGPVTEADLAVNEMLTHHLREARPGYGWLSEESEDDPARLRTDHVFIVDPIDGTRAFMRGARDWGHSIAVARSGQICAAAVYMPMLDLIYCATEDGPATLNGEPIRASGRREIEGAQVLCSKPALAGPRWREGKAPDIRRVYRSSLAYRLCLVAQGRFDAMLTVLPTWEWDVAAGSLIAERAGATVRDLRGNPPRFNQPTPQIGGLIAAPPPIGDGLHAALIS